MRLAPERTLGIFQKRADNSTNDELWGDLGDTYWQAGKTALAEHSWSKAFDPTDGEWTGKLASLAAGEDPLGNDSGFPEFGHNIIFEDFEVTGY